MAMNVQGHQMPEPHGVNEANPVFQRNPPQTPPPEVPLGLAGAVTLRSESAIAAGTVVVDPAGKPVGVSDGTAIVPINLDLKPVREDGGVVEDDEDDAPASDSVPDTPGAPEIPAGTETEPPAAEEEHSE